MEKGTNNKYFGGLRKDLSLWYFTIQCMNQKIRSIPKNVTAVCGFVHIDNSFDSIVAIVNNKRGVDVPGGHLEKDETPKNAFKREVLEEACVKLGEIKPFALLESDRDIEKSFIVFYFSVGIMLPFNPSVEVSRRQIMLYKDFIKNYCGNKSLMEALLFSDEYNKVKTSFRKRDGLD